MSQIFNKSSHPVAVKRIAVRVWALRDEIEAALARRIQECEAAGTPLYIDDIKEFYGMRSDKPLAGQPQLQLVEDGEPAAAVPTENVDQMMEALAPAAPVEAEAPAPATEAAAAPTDAAASGDATTPPEAAQKADEIIADQTPVEKAEAPKAPHLQRPYTRQVPDSTKISYGFALLADVNMDWMLAFSKEKFTHGQSVVIEFLIPRPFTLGAEVVLCTSLALRSRIISDTKPDYRLQCRFTYQIAGERTRLRDFLTSVEPEIPKKGKPAAEAAGPEA